MRKIHALGLAFVAMFAFSAFTATSAFAVSKVLFNNAEIVALLNVEVTGELLLLDTNAAGEPDILCSGIFDGMIEAGGTLGFIEELLTLAKELLAGAGGGDLIECTDDKNACLNPVDVEVLNMPWHIEVLLDAGGQYLAHFLNGAEEAGKQPTYHIDCETVPFDLLVEDLCEGLSSARLVNSAEGLLGYFNRLALTEAFGAASELTSCSVGGAGTGELVSVNAAGEDTEASGGLISPVGGGTLSVSE